MVYQVQLIALALAAAMAASIASAEDDPLAGRFATVERGRALVERNCAMCHAVGAAGASPNRQAPPFRDMNERLDVDALGEGLTQGILTGHPAMPEFRFQPHEVVSIVLYLKSIQAKRLTRMVTSPLR